MQTEPIARLGRKLRSLQRKSNWRFAASTCSVLDDDGKPNPKLAYRIAIEREEPSEDIMRRLINDGAIPVPTPEPLILSVQKRRAIILALQHNHALPLDANTARQIEKLLRVRRLTT